MLNQADLDQAVDLVDRNPRMRSLRIICSKHTVVKFDDHLAPPSMETTGRQRSSRSHSSFDNDPVVVLDRRKISKLSQSSKTSQCSGIDVADRSEVNNRFYSGCYLDRCLKMKFSNISSSKFSEK